MNNTINGPFSVLAFTYNSGSLHTKSSFVIYNISALIPSRLLSFNILGKAQPIILFGAKNDTNVIDDINILADIHTFFAVMSHMW